LEDTRFLLGCGRAGVKVEIYHERWVDSLVLHVHAGEIDSTCDSM
jgi:hypothetical protein